MKNIRKEQIFSAVLIIFALVGVYFAAVNVKEKGKVASATTNQAEQADKIKASVAIDFGQSKKILSSQDVREVEIENGKTALDLTKKVATVKTTGEGTNAFVTEIAGVAADPAKREFWELVINGQSSQVGAGSYKIKNGDRIEWKISSY